MGELGKLAGGAIGNAIAPGAGGVIGSALGDKAGSILSTTTGMLQNLQAKKLDQRAQSAMPSLIDPNQSSYLAELNQKRKSLETGSAFASANQAADTAQAQASNAIVNASGGDVGSTIQSLLQSQRAANDSKNNAIGQGQAQQLAVNNAYQDMLDQVSGRKLQLQMYNTQRLRALEAQKKTFANQNMNAGISRLLSGIKPSQPQIDDTPEALNSNPLLGKPQIDNTIMQGEQPPMVVPENNLATQSLGTPMAIQ